MFNLEIDWHCWYRLSLIYYGGSAHEISLYFSKTLRALMPLSSAFRHLNAELLNYGDYDLYKRHTNCYIKFCYQKCCCYRFHILKISFFHVELLILNGYFLRFISRIKYLLLYPTMQKLLFSSSLLRIKVSGPEGLAPVCCNTERHILPGALQGNLVIKVSQEISSPKVSLHYKENVSTLVTASM